MLNEINQRKHMIGFSLDVESKKHNKQKTKSHKYREKLVVNRGDVGGRISKKGEGIKVYKFPEDVGQ